MSQYKLEFKKPSLKDIEKLPTHQKKRIIKKLKFFIAHENPLSLAVRLKDFEDGQYRWRVGVYRIIFDVEDDIITILRIRHRKEVYKR